MLCEIRMVFTPTIKFPFQLTYCFNDLVAFNQVENCRDKENFSMEQMSNIPITKGGKQVDDVKKNSQAGAVGQKRG